ncbi:TetR/AcrR family transcriptional regulator [Granulicella sp. dw_53]|uniref:TetR/AcrR family transcriptional regulator n=1 Tax=Granulicella sp. dw_53 TaxID=2719792 RepID=UPI001BD49425|nr:TetR/AcrR family transcriptional regulator [Granulicella sp. dw_53]
MLKGEKTRRKIIEKAALLFNKKGFDGISMQDVSEATGLEKGSLYTHFSSKEELAKEAMAYASMTSFISSIENLEKLTSPVEKLKLHIRNVLSKPNFPGGCPLTNIAIDADDGNTVMYAMAQESLKHWTSFLKQLIKEAQEMEEIQSSVNPEAFATLIISLLEGACLASRLQRSKKALTVAQQFLTAQIDGYVKE